MKSSKVSLIFIRLKLFQYTITDFSLKKDSNTSKRILPTLPSTPFSQEPPKLKNVTDWLNKSFDRLNVSSTDATSNNTTTNVRSNSYEPIIHINDEPIVEISLTKDFYTLKNQQQLLLHKQKAKSLNIDKNLQKICLYKDPKEIECNFKSNKESFLSVRRPSLELGIQITGCQNIPDQDESSVMAALVTSIVPDGVVEKFKIGIEEGDEIFEINGFNLRNKSDDQIDEIFSSSCHSHNGEIELLVRRRSSVSSAVDFNIYSNSNNDKEIRNLSQENEPTSKLIYLFHL